GADMPARRGQRAVLVLGAGADAVFGVPTVNTLARALAEFTRTDGKAIDRALRRRVPNVRLSFDKVGTEAGENLVSRMFEDPTDVLPQFETLRARLAKLPGGGPVAEVLEALGEMAKRNEVRPELAGRLAKAAGAQGS